MKVKTWVGSSKFALWLISSKNFLTFFCVYSLFPLFISSAITLSIFGVASEVWFNRFFVNNVFSVVCVENCNVCLRVPA